MKNNNDEENADNDDDAAIRLPTSQSELEEEEKDQVMPLGEPYKRKKSKAIVKDDKDLFSRLSLINENG